MKTFSHTHVCSMSTNRDCFTSHGLHLNSQGINWMANKWVFIVTPIISKSRVISTTPLPWTEKSDKSYDEQKHRKELVIEGTNVTKANHNLSKEEIFSSVPEFEVDSEYSEEEEVLKEPPGSPISKRVNNIKEMMMMMMMMQSTLCQSGSNL